MRRGDFVPGDKWGESIVLSNVINFEQRFSQELIEIVLVHYGIREIPSFRFFINKTRGGFVGVSHNKNCNYD